MKHQKKDPVGGYRRRALTHEVVRMKEERLDALRRFRAPHFRKVAVVMLGSRPKPGKSEDAAEGSGFEFDPKPKSGGGSSGGAHVERLEDHIVNYHGDPCPECGHFTVIENAGLLGCDACGWAGKV